MTKTKRQQMWARAMDEVAAEMRASLPALAPAERRAAMARIAALGRASKELMSGVPTTFDPSPPPSRSGATAA